MNIIPGLHWISENWEIFSILGGGGNIMLEKWSGENLKFLDIFYPCKYVLHSQIFKIFKKKLTLIFVF